MFGASSGLFFVFFGACQCFCISHVKIMVKKVRFTGVLDPPSVIHRYLQCYHHF